MSHSPLSIDQANQIVKWATYAALSMALFLIIAKLTAWLLTGSVSVLASLVDSLMDALASGLNLLAVRWAITPADEDHRFGHGKAESLAGLGQAMFVAGSAIFLGLQAIDRILHPRPLDSTDIGIVVMLVSITCTACLVLYQRKVIRLTQSTAIKADSLHYLTDLITNLTIIVALILAHFGFDGIDPLFAIGLSLFILYNAYQIGYQSIHLLMDRELPDHIRQHIAELILSVPKVQGVHNYRTRQSGSVYFIYLHLELDENLSFHEAHDVTLAVIKLITQTYPNTEIFAHQDPMPPLALGSPACLRDAHPH